MMMMSADGRFEDAKFMESVYIALPILPTWRACMPKVRNAQFGFPDYSNVSNRTGSSHHGYERYYHESYVKKLEEQINMMKATLEHGRTEHQSG